VQASIIPITDDQVPYARELQTRLRDAGMRVEVNDQKERMQAKIRDAQLQKIPYMLVVGKREVENGQVAVRLRSGEDLKSMEVESFCNVARDVIERKTVALWDAGETPVSQS
jgi:threonyl-tRNA synthetase